MPGPFDAREQAVFIPLAIGRPLTPTGPAVRTQALTKKYGKTVAVNGVSVEVPRGGITAFVGPNGAGKTTTIRMILGLAKPTSGDAWVLGEPIDDPKRYLPRVGSLIEAPAFYPPLSGRRNLQVLAQLGGHGRDRVEEVLRLVSLGERGDDAYKAYSLGMKQRLGIAGALLADPELLVLDEPTNGLDPAGIREMRELLRRLAHSGKTVFVSSHLMAEVEKLCDHVVVIRAGQIVFQGPLPKLLAHQHGLIVRAHDPRNHARLAELVTAAGHAAQVQDGRVVVEAPPDWGGHLNVLAMKARIVLAEIRPRAGDLEETVLSMTGKGGL